MQADGVKCHHCGSAVDAPALNCPDCGAALAEVRDLTPAEIASVLQDTPGWKARLLRGSRRSRSVPVTTRAQKTTRRIHLGDNRAEADARICARCGAPAYGVSESVCEYCHAPLTTVLTEQLSGRGAHRHLGPADLELAVRIVEQQVPESLKASVADGRELIVQPCPNCESRGTWKFTAMRTRSRRGGAVDSSKHASLACMTCGYALLVPSRNEAPSDGPNP